MILKKNKKSNVKPFMVKNHVSVFVNALIENPAFDSQVRKSHRLCTVCLSSDSTSLVHCRVRHSHRVSSSVCSTRRASFIEGSDMSLLVA